MKFMKELRERFSQRAHFTSGDVEKFLIQKGAGKGYHKLLIYNLSRKGEIFRITRGNYTFHNGISSLESVFVPSYHGLQEALTILGVWG